MADPLKSPQEVLAPQLFMGKAPLDASKVIDTIADRDAIPDILRYHGFEVFVREDSTKYILSDKTDLTNTGWRRVQVSGSYLGIFDPTNPPVIPPKDNDPNFNAGDYFIAAVADFWNFTQGNQSPDGGGENVVNLVLGDNITYNSSNVWSISPAIDLVQSVNGKQGIVILKALDINIDPITGLTSTQTQEALEELKIITDGLSSGSLYLGSFDPAIPPTPPPIDGDDVNFNQGDFFQAVAAGSWDFNPNGGGRIVTVTKSDLLRYNVNSVWDVIPFDSFQNTDELPEGITNLYYTETRVSANSDVSANTANRHNHANKALLDSLTNIGAADNFLNEQGNYINVPNTPPGGTVEGAIQFRNTTGDGFVGDDNILSVLGEFRLNSKIIKITSSINESSLTDSILDFSKNTIPYISIQAQNNKGGFISLYDIVANLDLRLYGDSTSLYSIECSGYNCILLPSGTTAQRPIGVIRGSFRFNTDTSSFEGYNGTEWGAIGGGVDFIVQQITHSAEGALTIDFANGVYAKVALSANATSIVIANPVDGKYQLELVQDAIGGRVVSFSGMYSIDGSIPDYSVNANASSLINITIADGKTIISGMGNLIAIA